MAWLMGIVGACMLLDAWNADDFTDAKNEWQLGIGIGLVVLGFIGWLIRGDD